MSNAWSLMELPAGCGEVEGWNEAALPGPISQQNPALGELKLFDVAV